MRTNLQGPVEGYIFFVLLYLLASCIVLHHCMLVQKTPYGLFSWAFFLLFSYLLADFLTGIGHFILDNWPLKELEPYLFKVSFLKEIPEDILKKSSLFSRLGLDFRLHHSRMTDITSASPEELLFRPLQAVSIYVTTIAVLNFLFFNSPGFGYITFLSSIFILFSQYIHKWAHTHHNHRLVKLLQKIGIIISVKKHAKHHLDTSYNYSLISGWSNFFINAIIRTLRKNRLIF